MLLAHCMSSICAAYFLVFSSCFLKFLAISLDFQLKKHEEILTVHEHECTEECGFCDMDGDEQGIYSDFFDPEVITWSSKLFFFSLSISTHFHFPQFFFLEIHFCSKFPLVFFFFPSTLFAVC